MDKAIKATNANGTIHLQYSTPALYTAAKNKEPVVWPVKTGPGNYDFYPYPYCDNKADNPNAYFAGYFSSRPALKYYVRETSTFLQIVRHFEVFSGANGSASEQLWESQGVVQHHDGISGTAKQAVTFDYAQRLAGGIQTADEFLEAAVAAVVSTTGQASVQFARCPHNNVSVCEAADSGDLVAVVVYNPAARALATTSSIGVRACIRIPVQLDDYTVLTADSQRVPFQQIVPVMPTQAQPPDAAQNELFFPLDVPGLGLETVFLDRAQPQASQGTKATSSDGTEVGAAVSIQNDYYVLHFDGSTGLVASIDVKGQSVSYPFSQEFAYYKSYQGDGQHSGAYVFRPAEQYATPLTTPSTPVVISRVINGEYVQQVWQTVSDWIVQKVTLYKDRPWVEFEWTVGPIPVADGQGKEVISRFNTTIGSGGTWYTDANGREFQQRTRNSHPQWQMQPVSSNYFPVNAVQWLADDTTAMVAVNDRSQGGASISDGELEFMIHRRLLADDGRGVGEPLNEPGEDGHGLIITGRHCVTIVPNKYAAEIARDLQNIVYFTPLVTFTPVTSIQSYTDSHHTRLSYLATDLPSNVELITAQVYYDGSVLIRLAHQFGVNESDTYSQPATIDLATLFVDPPTAVHELSLTASYPAGTRTPMEWNTTDGEVGRRRLVGERAQRRWGEGGRLLDTSITLQPMEIRTFSLSFSTEAAD